MKSMMPSWEPFKIRKENFLRADFFTPSIFYRLFLADLFPQYDKAIYVDSDTVWNGDPAEMFAIALNDDLIGAAPTIP